MIKKIILTVCMCLALGAQALTVTSTAGRLDRHVENYSITDLTVNGTMDARDFYFINDNLKQLQTVDLSGVEVVAYDQAILRFLGSEFHAGCLPTCAFASTRVTTVVLPAGLLSIGKAAFAGCDALTSITLPATLTTVDDLAFAGCSALTSVTLPATVTKVGNNAFMRCTSLTSLTVEPSSQLQELGDAALADCPALTTLSLGTSLRSIGERAFAGTSISNLDLSASTRLTNVGDYAAVRTPITGAKMPNSVKTVGDGAFLYATQLQEVALSAYTHRISDFTFAGTALNHAITFKGVDTIGEYALYNVTQLPKVVLPASMRHLGTRAMAGMTGLTALTSAATTVPTLGRKVWDGVNQSVIPLTVHPTAKSYYVVAKQWEDFLLTTWIVGDVNLDGEINIGDINTIIDIILGANVDDDTLLRADVNNDGEINIGDINGVIDLIFSGSYHCPAVNTDDRLQLDDVTIAPGDELTLEVVLEGSRDYSALQCDITLPRGLTLVSSDAGEGAHGHIGLTHDMDAATSRTLLYSMEKTCLDNGGNAVLAITVRADDALTSDGVITLSNIVLADDDNVAWYAPVTNARVSNSTGVDDLTAIADRVWIEGRTLCIETSQHGSVQVAAVNGTARSMQLQEGVSRFVLEPGMYVVRLNGKSYKVGVRN